MEISLQTTALFFLENEYYRIPFTKTQKSLDLSCRGFLVTKMKALSLQFSESVQYVTPSFLYACRSFYRDIGSASWPGPIKLRGTIIVPARDREGLITLFYRVDTPHFNESTQLRGTVISFYHDVTLEHPRLLTLEHRPGEEDWDDNNYLSYRSDWAERKCDPLISGDPFKDLILLTSYLKWGKFERKHLPSGTNIYFTDESFCNLTRTDLEILQHPKESFTIPAAAIAGYGEEYVLCSN